jgi:hypothetical protein
MSRQLFNAISQPGIDSYSTIQNCIQSPTVKLPLEKDQSQILMELHIKTPKLTFIILALD